MQKEIQKGDFHLLQFLLKLATPEHHEWFAIQADIIKEGLAMRDRLRDLAKLGSSAEERAAKDLKLAKLTAVCKQVMKLQQLKLRGQDYAEKHLKEMAPDSLELLSVCLEIFETELEDPVPLQTAEIVGKTYLQTMTASMAGLSDVSMDLDAPATSWRRGLAADAAWDDIKNAATNLLSLQGKIVKQRFEKLHKESGSLFGFVLIRVRFMSGVEVKHKLRNGANFESEAEGSR